MRELSLFIDESGSDNLRVRCCLLTLVLHEQDEDVPESIRLCESVGELIEAAAVEGVTTATFGKFLAQHSVFMRLRGVAYNKKHTSTGQVITPERVAYEGSEGCRRI